MLSASCKSMQVHSNMAHYVDAAVHDCFDIVEDLDQKESDSSSSIEQVLLQVVPIVTEVECWSC